MAPGVQELHFPPLEIPIKVDRLIPVHPASPIPAANGDVLYLSNLDDMIGVRVFTPTVFFYRSPGPFPGQNSFVSVLRDALASVLVPYYPFSGRIREAKNGKLEVFFGPDQGALLVEAHTDTSIADLGDVTVPNPAWSALIYKFPDEDQYQVINMPLIIAQLTHFSCGGFSLGLRICHCICDGLGAMQFLRSWASTAKAGFLVTNPKPCWDREFFRPRNPPRVEYPHVEFKEIHDGSTLTKSLWEAKPLQKCYRITREYQNHLKSLAQSVGPCTTFDAMAAHVWRSFVKSLDVKPLDYELRLTFSVNVRQKLNDPPLKDGFYGNALCVACVTNTVSGLVNGSFQDTVDLVRKARLAVSEDVLRSTIDYVELERPKRLEFGGKLSITQWTRFSIYESADFGWGMPIYAGPIDLTPTPQICIFLPAGGSDAVSDGSMLLCICLPESASRRFTDLLHLKEV
ncbi:OLC1v1037230C1 [Oldenlandia corymbosa var. corymbosa]|uniref:OLC1v1037230C1 n=1 Tax=Oldenlandia corymbosa var. corymbosa TaxID=529605 RepID=A0AAV1CYL2_OLDCO|nr:OLC1v1037230C1 [Oldenlandia corymbosa var. corymbosa]